MSERETTLRIIIADAHELIRRGLQSVLQAMPEVQIVAELGNGSEVLDHCVRLQPEVLILSRNMQGPSPLQIAGQVRDQCPVTRVIILAVSAEADIVRSLVKTGVLGYLLKEEPAERVIDALRSVSVDQRYFSLPAASLLAQIVAGEEPDPAPSMPTAREQDVLKLLVQGLTDIQIATALGIGERTIRYHMTNLFNKAGVSTRTRLAFYALKQGWIGIDDLEC